MKKQKNIKLRATADITHDTPTVLFAELGIDTTVETVSGHKIELSVRNHGIRLFIDNVEQTSIDFRIDGKTVNNKGE